MKDSESVNSQLSQTQDSNNWCQSWWFNKVGIQIQLCKYQFDYYFIYTHHPCCIYVIISYTISNPPITNVILRDLKYEMVVYLNLRWLMS